MKQSIKSLLGLAVALCFGTTNFSQTQVQGRILEAAGKPLSFANILLFTAADSSFVKGEISDLGGTFTLAGLSPGSYRCKVSMVGFANQSFDFQLGNQPGALSLGDIVLDGSITLAEVEVTARKALA